MSLPADVRLIDLGFDPDTRTHYMALPSCISAEDAKAFHAFVGENTFELLDEPADWLVEKGLIEVEGVTFASQVIKIVHDLIENVKTILHTWWTILCEGREQIQMMRS